VTAYTTKSETPDIKLLNDRAEEAIKRLPEGATASQLMFSFANTMMGKQECRNGRVG
jgi:hypothetical protein